MYLYVACSGVLDENPTAPKGVASLLLVYSAATGALLAQHRFAGDMFNSAPLVVTPSPGTGAASHVILTTATGQVIAYAAGPAGVAAGPAWSTSGDIAGVPASELPSSTYSFLSATPLGTLLVTTTAGGAGWQKEKGWFAVINGVYPPAAATAPAPRAGLSAGAAAGIALGVLGAVAVGAYFTIPAFAAGVAAGGSALKGGLSSLASFASNEVVGGSAGGARASFAGSGGGYGSVGSGAA